MLQPSSNVLFHIIFHCTYLGVLNDLGKRACERLKRVVSVVPAYQGEGPISGSTSGPITGPISGSTTDPNAVISIPAENEDGRVPEDTEVTRDSEPAASTTIGARQLICQFHRNLDKRRQESAEIGFPLSTEAESATTTALNVVKNNTREIVFLFLGFGDNRSRDKPCWSI